MRYSFGAAAVRNILDFPDEFQPTADIVKLDRNYRSTQPILSAANGLIGLAKERFTKNLWTDRVAAQKPQLVTVRDEADQARHIAGRVPDLWAAERTLGEANADDVSLIGELHDVSSRFGATPYVHELLGSDET
jgi:superfamily I DNA/RNA helicase